MIKLFSILLYCLIIYVLSMKSIVQLKLGLLMFICPLSSTVH